MDGNFHYTTSDRQRERGFCLAHVHSWEFYFAVLDPQEVARRALLEKRSVEEIEQEGHLPTLRLFFGADETRTVTGQPALDLLARLHQQSSDLTEDRTVKGLEKK